MYNTSTTIEEAAESMFQALRHGDQGHQDWLKAAILAHMKGEPKPVFVETTKKN
jgi:hypothetical protein